MGKVRFSKTIQYKGREIAVVYQYDTNTWESWLKFDGETFSKKKVLGEGSNGRAIQYERKLQSPKIKSDIPRYLVVKQSLHANPNFDREARFTALIHEFAVVLFQKYMIIPYVEGRSLHEINITSFPQLLKLFIAATKAVLICHNRGVVHGDIKRDNIQITEEIDGLPVDFGSSGKIGDMANGFLKQTAISQKRAQFIKKYPHIDPDRLDSHQYHPKQDIYGLGYMLIRLRQNSPFDKMLKSNQTYMKLRNHTYTTNPNRPSAKKILDYLNGWQRQTSSPPQKSPQLLPPAKNQIAEEKTRQLSTASTKPQQQKLPSTTFFSLAPASKQRKPKRTEDNPPETNLPKKSRIT